MLGDMTDLRTASKCPENNRHSARCIFHIYPCRAHRNLPKRAESPRRQWLLQNLLYPNENPNLDQYLNIDTLPEGGLQVKVVYKTNSANVLVRTPRDEKTKSLVRQICDKNWHAAANTVTNHSELYPEVLNAVNKKASNEMSEYLKSESMLLCNKPDEITGFSNPVFLEEFCPVVYYLVLGASGIQESDVMHLSMLRRWGGGGEAGQRRGI